MKRSLIAGLSLSLVFASLASAKPHPMAPIHEAAQHQRHYRSKAEQNMKWGNVSRQQLLTRLRAGGPKQADILGKQFAEIEISLAAQHELVEALTGSVGTELQKDQDWSDALDYARQFADNLKLVLPTSREFPDLEKLGYAEYADALKSSIEKLDLWLQSAESKR